MKFSKCNLAVGLDNKRKKADRFQVYIGFYSETKNKQKGLNKYFSSVKFKWQKWFSCNPLIIIHKNYTVGVYFPVHVHVFI